MKDKKEMDEMIGQARQQIDTLLSDNTVPRNVKTALDEAKKALEGDDEYAVKVSTSTYKIDGVSNDINMPPFARTLVWNILSLLESVKE